MRKAQSRQLKAYLLFFEQLLANYLSQLAHVRDLFSWEEGHTTTYFTQPVSEFSDPQDVYNVDLDALPGELASIIETNEVKEERRSRFLEHLVARFSESFADYSILMFSMFEEGESRRR